MARSLRLIIALFIVAVPAVFGWYSRSPLIVPLLGAVYVPLYFLGKAGAWQALGGGASRTALLRAVPLTFVVQCCLVGVFYLLGLGLGALMSEPASPAMLTARDLYWIIGFAALFVPLAGVIAHQERATVAPPSMPSEGEGACEDEFATVARRVTAATFYRGWHFSRPNYTRTALVNVLDHKGDKPQRAPKRASAAMIAQAEARLGVALPPSLRDIYSLQDGGGLPIYYVPKFAAAPKVYSHWVTAFADDYNDLKPLAQLSTLHDHYMEYFDPEYSDPAEKETWLRGADKLVVLTARTGYGTALDYRKGETPGVLLFDNNADSPELMHFDSFDAFMAALHEVTDTGSRRANAPRDKAFGTPPDPQDPDRFWSNGNAGAGVTAAQWAAAGDALGVALPDALLPFYEVANGGTSHYKVAVDKENPAEPLHIFPTGPYVYAGQLSKVEHFATLATLSDRLDFIDGRTPWRELYDAPDKLIVISAAFDSALMLDYRNGDAPAVLAISDLDQPADQVVFPTVTEFLTRLRRYGVPKRDLRNEIGDERISARSSDATAFWLDGAAPAVTEAELRAFTDQWGYTTHGLPAAIKALYQQANGGPVRFRFAPPQQMNAYGHAITDRAAPRWVDVFPNGLLPMQNWRPLDDWRRQQGLATQQSLYDFTSRIAEPVSAQAGEALKLGLFVIGDHSNQTPPMVTVLDLSEDYFNRNRHVLTLRYDAVADRFEIAFGPIMSDHASAGLHAALKALKSDL